MKNTIIQESFSEIRMEDLFRKQQQLDAVIFRNSKAKEFKGLDNMVSLYMAALPKIINAVQVELGEFYTAQTEEDKLSEFVDVLHFILSVNNALSLEHFEIYNFAELYKNNTANKEITKDKALNEVYAAVSTLSNHLKSICKYWSIKAPEPIFILKNAYGILLNRFFILGNLYGYSAEQVYKGYLKKNNENFARQLSGNY